jgi:hypothetical protein
MSTIAERASLGRESLYKAFAPGAKPRYYTVLKVLHSQREAHRVGSLTRPFGKAVIR